jgi:hypothetical protein
MARGDCQHREIWIEVRRRVIFISSVSSLEEGGRPATKDCSDTGQPVADTPATSGISLPAQQTPPSSIWLPNRARPFKLKMRGEFRPGIPNSSEASIFGVPFRVAVIGRDSNDKQYRRFFSIYFAKAWKSLQNLTLTNCAEAETQVAFAVRTSASRAFDADGNGRASIREQGGAEELALGAGSLEPYAWI